MGNKVDVLVYGLGAIGGFYAFILSRTEDVRLTVMARSNYQAVKDLGLTVKSQNHGTHTIRPFNVVRSPAEAGGRFDYVVCAHKAIDQEKVPPELASVVDDDTTIVIIQNGVGNEDPFRAAFPRCSIITCVTWVGATQTSPGVIAHTTSEEMQMGLFPNPSLAASLEQARLDRFAALLRAGRTVFTLEADMQKARWHKVVWNAAWNPLTTLTLLDTHAWLGSSPEALPMTRRLMREVIDVARALGIGLEYALADELIQKVQGMQAIGSSMRTDCEAGRPMEVEFILGTPLRKAQELGIDVPTVQTTYAILKGVDARLRQAKL